VRDLLADIGIEASSLSAQLAVLRRSGVVRANREGTTVVYALTSDDVGELLRVARKVLFGLLDGQNELLAMLRAEERA
jgi:ArsR family transcriptional regulator